MTAGELIAELGKYRPGSRVFLEDGRLMIEAQVGGKIPDPPAPDAEDLGRGVGSRWIDLEVPVYGREA
jgi:hypothetical protein